MLKCPCDGSPLTVLHNEIIEANLIPGFEIQAETGHGSTGKVYKAKRLASGETVAIKILHLPLVDDLELVQRFKQEAELTSRLSSRHIVAVTEYGLLNDGRPYMVMDYIEGPCVSTIVTEEGPMSPERALPIFIQVATGLAHAHEQGIMHRDIKLTNIMLVEQDGEHDVAKIVDFGIAKQWQKSTCDETALTMAGEALGSPLYMSPEQCRGKAMDHRTDIYSLGSVMYEMLTGRALFNGPDAISIMTQHIMQPPSPMALPPSEVSREIEEIVFKALAKDPDDRHANVNALRSELQFCHYNLQTINLGGDSSVPHAA
jgi:serine/threonine protein kinase